MTHEDYLRKAIALATENVAKGGGPFGAVIVRNGEVLATGVNRVTANCDPTAHAEVCAIRNACAKLGTFKLDGCTIYASCEPCPMCLSAIYWAHIDRLFYAADKHDAAEAGFDDSFIYREIARDVAERRLKAEQLLHEEARAAFRAWMENAEKTAY